MFTWIRKRVADAVVAGFGDGLERVGVQVEGKADAGDATAAANVERLLPPASSAPATGKQKPK